MSGEDRTCLNVGREVVRMIRDLYSRAGNDRAYARREITFPGGKYQLIIASRKELADLFDEVADCKYRVATVTPDSQVN